VVDCQQTEFAGDWSNENIVYLKLLSTNQQCKPPKVLLENFGTFIGGLLRVSSFELLDQF
jgi:hypothetical protein